jgi:Holliday junction DNA helicase RuvB
MSHDDNPLRHGFDHALRRSAYSALSDHRTAAVRAGREAEARIAARRVAKSAGPKIELKPLSFDERSGNELRPQTFDQLVGQARLKALFARIIDNAQRTGQPLDHMLLTGASGSGKTTFAQCVAHRLGRTVYQVEAPVGLDVLEAMRVTCKAGDVVIVDEVHMIVQADRRGVTQAAKPEDFYHALEDRRLPTPGGMVDFPAVTFVGCTTDSGLLPEAMINRFPLDITLDPYTWDDMAVLAQANARSLGLRIEVSAAATLGRASRRSPRQLNTFVKNARSLGSIVVTDDLAREVIHDLNGCTWDGLTRDMQMMLTVLLRSRRESRDGHVVHQASVNTVATALGHGRDTKAIALFVEPFLIAEGLVCVTHGGRQLSEAGITRARELEHDRQNRQA